MDSKKALLFLFFFSFRVTFISHFGLYVEPFQESDESRLFGMNLCIYMELILTHWCRCFCLSCYSCCLPFPNDFFCMIWRNWKKKNKNYRKIKHRNRTKRIIHEFFGSEMKRNETYTQLTLIISSFNVQCCSQLWFFVEVIYCAKKYSFAGLIESGVLTTHYIRSFKNMRIEPRMEMRM